MGVLVNELLRIATLQGVEIQLQSKVASLESGPAGVRIKTESGQTYLAREHAIASLNPYLIDPIESVLAPCSDGSQAIEVKSPLDLDREPVAAAVSAALQAIMRRWRCW